MRNCLISSLLTESLRESVSISPPHLVPRDAKGNKFVLEKVDCALYLNPTPHLSTKIQRKLETVPIDERSVNQTSAGFLRHLPLFASIELKRQTLGTDPLVQLGIWTAALAERLRRFQREGENESDLKFTLALTVVGHDWKIYYCFTTEDGDRVSSDHRPCYARRKS